MMSDPSPQERPNPAANQPRHKQSWEVREVLSGLLDESYAYTAIRTAAFNELRRQEADRKLRHTMSFPQSDGSRKEVCFNDSLASALKIHGASISRAWATGAILTAAQALERFNYFDKSPCLQLIYHLRNGVAHGNKFAFTDKARDRLAKWPAHLPLPDGTTSLKVKIELEGTEVLFRFIDAAGINACFCAAIHHLEQIAWGHISHRPAKAQVK